MPKTDIHLLEERVMVLIDEFRLLKKEHQVLSSQVDQLNREKQKLIKENSLKQGSEERLSQLESLSIKNEKDRKAMRVKVQSLIDNLDKFDLA